jgi:hypothetical protein
MLEEAGGFLPPTAQYLAPYSKCPEAAALFAGLTWIATLLKQYPDTICTDAVYTDDDCTNSFCTNAILLSQQQ